MHEQRSIAELLAQIQNTRLPAIDLSLDRMRVLLAALGNPQHRLPPVIHVAGTNGKGSVIAYLQAIFQAAGYTPHRYTSPHLVKFHERIVLAGRQIGDSTLLDVLARVSEQLDEIPATFFESTTAAAFLAFSEHPANVLLLEVGLGGRLDATNVIDKPLATIITPIGYDHQAYLGNTLAEIAGEKAGIIKPGVPCIVADQPPEAMAVIERIAKDRHASLIKISPRPLPALLSLPGVHQQENAQLALTCLDTLGGYNIAEKHLIAGLQNAHWPGRLQQISSGVWLDGGHNAHAAQALAAWLQTQPKPAALICGMMKDKDAGKFLGHLAPYVAQCYTVAVPGEARSFSAQELADQATDAGIHAHACSGWKAALELAQSAPTVLIAGSLYLAGHVLANHLTEAQPPIIVSA